MLGRTLLIGAGSMGGAILGGALEHKILDANQVFVTVRREAQAVELAKELRIETSVEIPDLSDFKTVILAVKPQVLPTVLLQLKTLPAGATVISVAAGITLATLTEALPQVSWYRAMPNTPLAVGAGFTALATTTNSKPEITEQVETLFKAVGEVALVTEADLDRLGALSGVGPGFAFVIMDALADAGVRIGLTRDLAIKAAAHTLYGAGLLAVETGKHPAVLRDQVTSPGGTTIAGITAMEKGGIRSALQAGVMAALERSNELGQKK